MSSTSVYPNPAGYTNLTSLRQPHHRAAITLDHIPQALRERRQWVNESPDTEGQYKVPRNPHTGGSAKVNVPTTWGTLDDAIRRDPAHLGFVFTPDDGLVGLDVDDCRDAITGEIDDRGRAMIDRFPALYWEVSLSGTGIHGIGYGVLPDATSGKHPKGIGVFDRGRQFAMTGNVLDGHETLGAYGDGLAAWYRETFPSTPVERRAAPASVLTLDDQEIVTRLRNGASGKARQLLDGNPAGYPSYSEARLALANLSGFYTDDPEQIERIVRASGLFNPKDRDRDRDRKARLDAEKAVREYTGPRYDPSYGQATPIGLVTTTPAAPAEIEPLSCADVRDQLAAAQAQLALAHTFIARQGETIGLLRHRVAVRDARERVRRNTKLGACRTTAAVLGDILVRMTPQEPDSPYPYRLPLARLGDHTGLSLGASSRQLHQIETFINPETDDSVIRVETRPIPRRADPETGEILGPSREVWVGTSIPPAELTAFFATFEPDNAKKHGGARTVCDEHPEARVVRREQTQTRVIQECAHCRKVLRTETIPVGRETWQHIACVDGEPVVHDANWTHDPAPDAYPHDALAAVADGSDPVVHDANGQTPAAGGGPDLVDLHHAKGHMQADTPPPILHNRGTTLPTLPPLARCKTGERVDDRAGAPGPLVARVQQGRRPADEAEPDREHAADRAGPASASTNIVEPPGRLWDEGPYPLDREAIAYEPDWEHHGQPPNWEDEYSQLVAQRARGEIGWR